MIVFWLTITAVFYQKLYFMAGSNKIELRADSSQILLLIVHGKSESDFANQIRSLDKDAEPEMINIGGETFLLVRNTTFQKLSSSLTT